MPDFGKFKKFMLKTRKQKSVNRVRKINLKFHFILKFKLLFLLHFSDPMNSLNFDQFLRSQDLISYVVLHIE